MPGPFDNFLFSFGPSFIGIVFLLITGVIVFSIIKGIRTWKYNNSQPVLIVPAILRAKRTEVSRHRHTSSNHHHHHSRTRYYVTFEVESGDRMEFQVSGQESGMLVEGDKGKLKFQGTRYLGFERRT